MLDRHLKPCKDYSFFLFGPRGAGKTTLIKKLFYKNAFLIDLLDSEIEEKFLRSPSELKNLVAALDPKIKYVIIDEVQKIPKLLDLVHLLIETTKVKFILTGSSARKLKYGSANLLAGRAFVYNLHPYTSFELAGSFDLDSALHWGLLPKVQELDDSGKKNFLKAYSRTYLKEEIWAEQFIKKLEPFAYFLELAAQMNGKILNYSKISRDVGVDDTTIRSYYSILEDTLLGFSLPGFNHSFRKQLNIKPKFYLFDSGVKRALANTLSNQLVESSFAYGDAFEHFVILEIYKLVSYFNDDYKLSYLKTKDDAEIDLVVERPGKKYLFIEIKSSKQVREEDLGTLETLAKDFGDCEPVCFSRDSYKKIIRDIPVYPWQEGLREYFLSSCLL